MNNSNTANPQASMGTVAGTATAESSSSFANAIEDKTDSMQAYEYKDSNDTPESEFDVEDLEVEKIVTIDLTKDTTAASKLIGVEKVYGFPSEQNLAKYALTMLINKYQKFVSNVSDKAQPPDIVTIDTDIKETTKVFQDVYARLEYPIGDETHEIHIMAVYSSSNKAYIIKYASRSERALEIIQAEFRRQMELNNFYQGKSLKFGMNGVEFIQTPDLPLEKAVLPEKITKEFELNVVKFLSEDKYHSITKKRALLLYGPPGTGKTTIIKSHFYLLRKHNITAIFISDATFKNFPIEDVFAFIKKYLSPAMIAFEDIDLMGEDRDRVKGGIIGSLLAVLNGVEDYNKPVVIVSTTNKFDILDDAVTRPCRFDRRILVNYPTTENLHIMFKNIMGFNPRKADNIVQSEGNDTKDKLTGAHIQEICNTIQILAKERDCDVKDVVGEAVEIIKENFYIGAPTKAGFDFED
jgi:adenylate kinase family enzyme